MASYSFHLEPIARSGGRSAAAASAYALGMKIENPRDGMIHDFRPKARSGGVADAFTVMPDGSHVDSASFWGAVELHHKRGDAVPARSWMIALPHELTLDQNKALVRQFSEEFAAAYGVAVSAGLHPPDKKGDQRNWHFHGVATACAAMPEPDAGFKLGKKVAALDPIACKRASVENAADVWRPRWEQMCNAALEAAGSDARVDHRTLVAQREAALAAGDMLKAAELDRAPTEHLGVKAVAIERKNPGHKSARRKNIERRQRDYHAMKSEASALDFSIAMTETQLRDNQEALRRERGLRTKDAMTRRIAAQRLAKQQEQENNNGRTGPDKPDLERSPAPTTSAGQRPTARGAGVRDQRSDRARALDIPEGALAGLEQRMRNVPLVDMEPMGRRHAAGALRQDVRHNVDLGRARAGDRGLLSTRSGAPDPVTLTLPRTGHKSFRPVVFTGPATSFFSRLRKKRPGELTPEQKRQLEQMAERLAHLIMKLVCRLFGIDYQTPDEQQQHQQERRRPRLAKVAPPPRPQPGPAPGPKVAPVPAGPGPASQAQDLKSRSQQVLEQMRSRKSEHRTTTPAPAPTASPAAPAAGRPAVVDPRAAADAARRQGAERRISLALQSGKGKSAALVDAVRNDDPGSLDRLIEAGADPTTNRGAALEAAAHAKRDDLFGRLLRGVPLQDHSDLQQLAQRVGPEASAKLRELAKTAKAGGSLEAAGIEQPQPNGPQASGPSAGPKMAGPK